MKRARTIALIALSLVAILILMLWAIASGFVFSLFPDRIVSKFCSAHPRLAWRIGTGDMQTKVVYTLSHQVQKGMSYGQVTPIFGVRPARVPLPDGTTESVSFPVRPEGECVGVVVYFISNRVADVVVWD